MKILISHPGKQHVYRLVHALEKKFDVFFYSTFVFTKGWIMEEYFIPKIIRNYIKKRFLRTYSSIKRIWIWELLFYLRKNFFDQKKQQFLRLHAWRQFDIAVSRKIERLKPDVFIGYETSSLHSFLTAKNNGCITILDLAYVHYKKNLSVQEEHPVFAETFKELQFYEQENKLKEEELKYVDYILCLSTLAENSLLKAEFEKERIYRYNLGVSTHIFTPKIYPSDNGKKIKLLYVGGITIRKGLDIIYELSRLLKDIVEISIVGHVIDKSLFEKLINEPNVIYKGFLEHDRLVDEYHGADVFIFPSYLDSWGQVVLEAMACGLPVIVSDNTGAKDAITADCGFIVPTGDLNAFKETIMYLYNNMHLIEVKGDNARRVAENYDLDKYAKQMTDIINEIGSSQRNTQVP